MEFVGRQKTSLAIIVITTFILTLATNANARQNQLEPLENPAASSCRKHSASLTDFGGVGDGKTLNTKAFQRAIENLSKYQNDGGALLYVPPGKWLTGSFNLTSNFTLFLEKDAVLLAIEDPSQWEIIAPLPSYGRGRDTEGGRYISLIFGDTLKDVVITGNNGTLDGQGQPWWDKYKAKQLNVTRPYLIEILNSEDVQISYITLVNSPSWNIHPTYCKNVIVQGVTILAPVLSPNTDGINPDSCFNTRIEDCYIVSGDDCIAVKSGWDQYGIKFGMPTRDLVIRRLTCISPYSALIALGSEMSGGIQNVRGEDLYGINTEAAVRIKSAPGRGAYVKDIFVRRVSMNTMKHLFLMSGDYGQHVDDGFDPKAIPVVENINYRDMVAKNVTQPAKLSGLAGAPFTGICISNVTIELAKEPQEPIWNCTNIAGVASGVTPAPCNLLKNENVVGGCHFPTDKLAIENVPLRTCAYKKGM